MWRLAGMLLVVIFLPAGRQAAGGGAFNKKIKIGDPAPGYSGLPGVDGKWHALADLKDKNVVVVVFTCNKCPIATAYEKRLIDFAAKYAGPGSKTALVAINVSTDEGDRLPEMVQRARTRGFNFPYLYDESQKIGRAFGATVTPEFFVLNKERKVVYMGAMDDGVNPISVTTNYLVPAVESALKGDASPLTQTAARGCNIIYESATKDTAPGPVPSPGKASASDVELKLVKLDQLVAGIKAQTGKVVVLDVWASFCVPCKKEFPRLIKLHEDHAKDGLVCMSLSVDDLEDRQAALDFLKGRQARFANYLIDERPQVWQSHFAVKGVPAVFIWDRAGKQVARFDGDDPDNQFNYGQVEKKVRELLKGK